MRIEYRHGTPSAKPPTCIRKVHEIHTSDLHGCFVGMRFQHGGEYRLLLFNDWDMRRSHRTSISKLIQDTSETTCEAVDRAASMASSKAEAAATSKLLRKLPSTINYKIHLKLKLRTHQKLHLKLRLTVHPQLHLKVTASIHELLQLLMQHQLELST